MNCGTQKAVKLVKELDSNNGIGLIEKKRLGLGKPNVIYVKNFMLREVPDQKPMDSCADLQSEQKNHRKCADLQSEQGNHEECANLQSEAENREKTGTFLNCENHHSRIVEITKPEYPKSQSNNTDINKTDISETEINQSYPIISGNLKKKRDVMEEMRAYREVIHENIDYQYHAKEDVDELVELMIEVMMMPEDSMIRIAGVEKPAYLLTALYNAPATINSYYQAEVNHDMYGG